MMLTLITHLFHRSSPFDRTLTQTQLRNFQAATMTPQYGIQQPSYADEVHPLFTSLAAEIRLNVYTQLFTPNSSRPLRRLNDMRKHRREPRVPIPDDILRTSQLIHTEALPVFYASYTFHVTLNQQLLPYPGDIKQHQLKHIRHISIGTSFLFDKEGDTDLAIALASIKINCDCLKTLTLHFLTTLDGPQPRSSKEWAVETAPVLRSLLSRLEKLTLVAAVPNNHISSLRAAIVADTESWESKNLEASWPMVRLSLQQNNKISLWRNRRLYTYGRDLMRRIGPSGDEYGICSSHIHRKQQVKNTEDANSGSGDGTSGKA